jgi:hypothetical protein
MAAVKLRDRQFRDAAERLESAEKRGDAAAAKTESQALANRSRELERDDAESAKRQIFWVNTGTFVVGAIALGILLVYIDPWDGAVKDTRQAWGWTAAAMFAVYTLLGVIGWGDGGLLSYIRGKDGRLSTSLLQVGLWTVAVSTALVYFIFVALYSKDAAETFKTSLGARTFLRSTYCFWAGPSRPL